MKIRFDIGQKSHERHQTSVIEELRRRGHDVVVTACTVDGTGLVEHKLPTDDHRNLLAFTAHIRDDAVGPLIYEVRTARDYLRYLRPEHAKSEVLARRARNMLLLGLGDDPDPKGTERWLTLLEDATGNVEALAKLDAALERIEMTTPPHPAVVAQLEAQRPDLLCLTPMLMTQYGQTELAKAARALGIPIVFLVGSWDNLTTKGTTHLVPDATIVWNALQIDEAATYHGIARSTVHACGAPRFDEFWERKVTIPYADYCARHGFDPDYPIITYLGSSNLIVPDEVEFVAGWIAALRASSLPSLARANILLRPHPKFSKGWSERFSSMTGVALSISKILNNDEALFMALSHSRAAVGANTSAELEAAIVDCPIFTIKDETFALGQGGTIHFNYLADALAKVAASRSEHVAQLAEELSRERQAGHNRAFVEGFLRPMGLDRPASTGVADVIEATARSTLQSPRAATNRPRSLPGSRARPGVLPSAIDGLIQGLKATKRKLGR